MSPPCLLLPVRHTAAGADPFSQALSRVSCCRRGFSPSAGISRLRRATASWLGGRRKAKKQSVLALIKSHIFLTSYFTNKTKAALKWMHGLAGCQRRAGDKGWEYKCGAGSGEPRMPLRQGERVAMETRWPNRGKKGPALGWTGSHRRHGTQETGALVPPVRSWTPEMGLAPGRQDQMPALPHAGARDLGCPGGRGQRMGFSESIRALNRKVGTWGFSYSCRALGWPHEVPHPRPHLCSLD